MFNVASVTSIEEAALSETFANSDSCMGDREIEVIKSEATKGKFPFIYWMIGLGLGLTGTMVGAVNGGGMGAGTGADSEPEFCLKKKEIEYCCRQKADFVR